MIGAWTANRIGVRLSPSSFLYGVDDGNKLATFGFVVRALDALDALGVGYLCLLETTRRTLRGAYRSSMSPRPSGR
jgi:N-ethylmaleimide reductase